MHPGRRRRGKTACFGGQIIDALDALRGVYSQPTAYAAACKAQGTRVVGYFCDSLPIELIEAAGLLPHRITGYPAPSREVLDNMLFAHLPKGFWQVRQSSLEFLNHSFGRLVDGTYSMLNALVIPNTRKPLLNMYGQLRAAKAAFPDLHLPHLFVLDRAATRAESARAFNRDSILKFRADLEAWLARPIEDTAIRDAVARRREIAKDLRELVSWRRLAQPGISGTDMLSVIGAAMFMKSADYGGLVRALVAHGPRHSANEATTRIFMGGSPPDNAQLYQMVESLGATIVGEDHCWGERYVDFTDDVETNSMSLLARRWDCSAACGFRLPFKTTTENVVRRAQEAKAHAVILNVFRHDETQSWDTPGQVAALRGAGVPVLHLSEQPHVLHDRAALNEQIQHFLRTVRTSMAEAS
jgi:benzoyl-CoA reductase/2-hydroxyglutaryl-CoA dehydratase subunit BcrC/BadD/HgdB